MRPARLFLSLAVFLASAGACGPAVAAGPQGPAADPLAVEIERWTDYLTRNSATDELWLQVKQSAGPVLERARQAVGEGHRLLALNRLLAARELLAAAQYVQGQPASARSDVAAFEAEWRRLQGSLGAPIARGGPASLAALRPALHRALAEAALPKVKVYYDASLEYGRNTMPESGLFYLGEAQAQLDLVGVLAKLADASTGASPSSSSSSSSSTSARAPLEPRSLLPEFDALEAELLAAYRPPASIEKHGAFIAASSTLKEARELEAAGLHHGALLRYLQAAQRVAPLRSGSAPDLDAEALAGRIAEWEGRLKADGRDDTIARLFLEEARAGSGNRGPGGGSGAGMSAPAIVVTDVLPRYVAALAPARVLAQRPDPAVTVTLVRWPYT